MKYKKTLRIAGICVICWLYALAFAALASSCSGEDERGEGRGDALVVFYLVLHYVARTAVDLLGDVIAELRTGEGFLLTLGIDQVGRFHHDDGDDDE